MPRNKMTILISGFGLLLVVTGMGAYILTQAESITALIPAFIGIPMLLAAWLTVSPKYRLAGVIAAIVLAVLMIAGSSRGIGSFISGITGKSEISGAAWLQVSLVVLAIIFLLIIVRLAFTRGRLQL